MSKPCLSRNLFSELINAGRFAMKFKQIVRDEAGENFISKLHRGKLAMIPWPVIQTTKFYELFGTLRTRLEERPITHKNAGEFLRVLKMLMAKLKVRTRTTCPIELVSEILFRLAIGEL